MKNEYAYNSENNLIHISEIQKGNKEHFTCCNCGNILIPKKGIIRNHHFSHKRETNCSYESYLHKVSKLKFFDAYRKCLIEQKPFLVDYQINKSCNSCINSFNISCELDTETKSYDLTKIFDKIEIEKSHNGFVADILLKSSKTNQILFIEFAVSHKCEQEKIQSGIRIVEINLKDDTDLNFIDEKHIKSTDLNNNFYNFKTNHFKEDFISSKNCKMLFDIYIIYQNNKTISITEQMRNIINEINNDNVMFYEIRKTTNRKYDFEEFVINYSFKNSKYKNCFSCRFFTENNSYYSTNKYFCKRLRNEIENSNFGANCEKYWRLEKK